MENLDLTLSLGLPKSGEENASPQTIPFINLATPNEHQNAEEKEKTPIGNGDASNVNINLLVSSYLMSQFGSKRSTNAAAGVFEGTGSRLHDPNAAIRKEFVLLDVPPRRAEREFVAGNPHDLNAGRGAGNKNGDLLVSKRCTNLNCHTSDTPMWRRGPLGPKTLCNACGIKYRKEEEKKKAREAGFDFSE